MGVSEPDSRPQAKPPLFPHGSIFVLTFSILACLAAGALVHIGMEVWSAQGLSKEGHTIAIAGGVVMLGVSLLLLVIAVLLIVAAPAPLRIWQHLMLLAPPALAALLAGITLIAANH